MIRNVVLISLAPGADRAAVAQIQEGLRRLDPPGAVNYTLGDDLDLREGNWSFAIVADFIDVAAYRRYDEDAEHNALRGALAPHAAQIARVQYELPDA